MPKQESILENETVKILWEIKLDHLIPARSWLKREKAKKKKKKRRDLPFTGFCRSTGPQSESWKKNKKKNERIENTWTLPES